MPFFHLQGQKSAFTIYSLKDGLPQSQVQTIFQSNTGELWIGTKGGGLAVYNGHTFKSYSIKNGLSGSFVNKILESKGKIYIGTSIGLSVKVGENFREIPISGGAHNISYLDEDCHGHLIIGSNQGLYRLENDTIVRLYEKGVQDGIVRTNCELIISAKKGLLGFKDNRFKNIFENSKSINLITVFKESESGEIFIGTYGNGIWKTENNELTQIPFLENEIITDLIVKEKLLWVTTLQKGLHSINLTDSSITNYKENGQLEQNSALCLEVDHWQQLWIGLNGGGLAKYSGVNFERLSSKEGLSSNYIYGITKDKRKNRMIFSTGNNGLYVIDSSRVLKTIVLPKKIKIRPLLAADSSIWLGTDGEGLFSYTDDSLINKSADLGLKGNWITKIIEDLNNTIWVATADAGINKINPKTETVKNFSRLNGLLDFRIEDLTIDSKGDVWYLTKSKGFGFIKDDSTVVNYNEEISNAKSLVVDTKGVIWISTVGNGLFKYSFVNETIVKSEYKVSDGLSSNNLYQIILDQTENLWIGSEQGLDNIMLNDNREVMIIDHFGYKDGFIGIETTTRAATKGFGKDLWFGTVEGLMLFNEKNESLKKISPPKLSINKLLTNYKESTLDKQTIGFNEKHLVEFSENIEHVGFRINGVDLSSPNEIFYKYRLLGLTDQWSSKSTNSEIHFSNLTPGNYTFQVIAKSDKSGWSKKSYLFRFKIHAPFWQKIWFILAVICLALLLFTFFVKRRLAHLYRNIKQKEEKLKLEREALELEQKALRLQMNPHFIFNCLNSVQAMIVKEDKKSARMYLSKFSGLMRKVLENSMSSEISLEDEISTLEDYLALESMTRNDSFSYEINIKPNDTETSEIFLPPMLVQPFVENSIIHGISGLKEEKKGLIKIEFNIEEQLLRCLIIDNGVGRAATSKKKSQTDQNHKSAALIISQKRLSNIFEDKHEAISIIDRFDDSGNAIGTEVKLIVPLR